MGQPERRRRRVRPATASAGAPAETPPEAPADQPTDTRTGEPAGTPPAVPAPPPVPVPAPPPVPPPVPVPPPMPVPVPPPIPVPAPPAVVTGEGDGPRQATADSRQKPAQPARGGYPRRSGPGPGGGDERESERGLRGLVGSGSSQVSVGAALRARDASRPTDDDLAEAEANLTIVRRNWLPREELPRR